MLGRRTIGYREPTLFSFPGIHDRRQRANKKRRVASRLFSRLLGKALLRRKRTSAQVSGEIHRYHTKDREVLECY